MVMVRAGDPVDKTIQSLIPHLSKVCLDSTIILSGANKVSG